MNMSLDDPPTVAEMGKAIAALSSDKAPVSDAITAEIYKLSRSVSFLKDSGVQRQSRRNSRISLLSTSTRVKVPGSATTTTVAFLFSQLQERYLLLNRLLVHLEQGLLPESQCGFRKGRGTTDIIFAARQLQEKCQEQHRHLSTTFVDLTKAFDTICRE